MALFLSLLSSISTVINAIASYQMKKNFFFFLQSQDTKFCISFSVFRAGIAGPLNLHWSIIGQFFSQQAKQKKNPREFDCLIQFRINLHPFYALLNVHNSPECFEILSFHAPLQVSVNSISPLPTFILHITVLMVSE